MEDKLDTPEDNLLPEGWKERIQSRSLSTEGSAIIQTGVYINPIQDYLETLQDGQNIQED